MVGEIPRIMREIKLKQNHETKSKALEHIINEKLPLLKKRQINNKW